MIYSNDPNLAKLNAEIGVLRVAVLNLIELAGVQSTIIESLRGDGGARQLRAHGVPTVHVDAWERASAKMLKKLGYVEQQ